VRIGACILAGGLSQRMGRDKARLRLGRQTLLSRIRATAQELGLPVRVIRRDIVPRCGPLGGIYTGLKTSRADAELFLACDMPFVSEGLLTELVRVFHAKPGAVFAGNKRRCGFPCLLLVEALPTVAAQIDRQACSLQSLARELRARFVRGRKAGELFNINTRADWLAARAACKPREQKPVIDI
jgi:molybdopterin-guanine dinucleotide biosynthesis protein A